MQKIYYYILPIIWFIICVSCSQDSEISANVDPTKSISIKLVQDKNFSSKLTDEDNPEEEQVIKNISVFFIDPLSGVLTNKYIYPGFTSVDDYKLIALPLDPATIQTKDIYVVANYDDISHLNAISTLVELKKLKTPKVDKTNNLTAQNGFCMYGSTLDYNFNDNTDNAAIVNLIRACAKYRINVTFPQNPALSTKNSFLIEHAAKYTDVIKNLEAILPPTDYYTYAAPIPLVCNGSYKYTNTTYIYEAYRVPRLYIYTHIGGSSLPQEYSANLPLPTRNYFYDINIDIYEDMGYRSKSSNESKTGYIYKTDIKIYDIDGVRINLGSI